MRRGACPGLSAPMQTGDGLLARLTPAGSISLAAFAGICDAARRHGNGIIEITSRGSVQIRGLTAATAAGFAADIAELGIPANDGIPVIAGPLSGLDRGGVLDAAPVAAELRRALAGAPSTSRLSAKLSVVVDGGGLLHLDELPADIRLRAVRIDDEARFHVALGGTAATAIPLGAVLPGRAAECVVKLIDVLAGLAPHARMRAAVDEAGLDAFASAVEGMIGGVVVPSRPAKADPIGIHPLRSGHVAIGVAPPFGHSDAETLQALIDLAAQAGATELRAAPKRALLLVGIPAAAAPDVAAAAATIGFIVDAGDPRRRVIACAGAPVCSQGQIPARALAPRLAELMSAGAAPGILHVSGCSKGCAYPAAAPITIVGRDGACDIYQGDDRIDSVAIAALPERLGPLLCRGARS